MEPDQYAIEVLAYRWHCPSCEKKNLSEPENAEPCCVHCGYRAVLKGVVYMNGARLEFHKRIGVRQ